MNQNKANELIRKSDAIDLFIATLIAEVGSERINMLRDQFIGLFGEERGLAVIDVLTPGMELTHEVVGDLLQEDQMKGGLGSIFLDRTKSSGVPCMTGDEVDIEEIILMFLAKGAPRAVKRAILDILDEDVSAKAGSEAAAVMDDIDARFPDAVDIAAFAKKNLNPDLQGPTRSELARQRPRGRVGSSLMAVLTALAGGNLGPSLGSPFEHPRRGGFPTGSLTDLFSGPGMKVVSLDELLGGPLGGIPGKAKNRFITFQDILTWKNVPFGLTPGVEGVLRRLGRSADVISMDGVREMPLRDFRRMNVLMHKIDTSRFDEETQQILRAVLRAVENDLVTMFGSIDNAISSYLAENPTRREGEKIADSQETAMEDAVMRGDPTPNCNCGPCNAKRRARGEATL